MMKNIVKKNILLFTVILFLSLFSIFVYFKPNTVFDKDGSPLNFGLGYTKKNHITNMVNCNNYFYYFLFIYFILCKFKQICFIILLYYFIV